MNIDHDLYDPLGIEIFAIDETFESMFNALKGVYFRLYFKESIKPVEIRNISKVSSFMVKFKEFSSLKRSFQYNNWLSKRKAVNMYAKELREMLALELSEYKTINDHTDFYQ